MSKKLKGSRRALVYLVLICFGGMLLSTYLFYQESQEVRRLNSHKDVLIDRLAETTLEHKRLQHQHDSLVHYYERVHGGSLDTDVPVEVAIKRKL